MIIKVFWGFRESRGFEKGETQTLSSSLRVFTPYTAAAHRSWVCSSNVTGRKEECSQCCDSPQGVENEDKHLSDSTRPTHRCEKGNKLGGINQLEVGRCLGCKKRSYVKKDVLRPEAE